jgi:UDP-N-acetylglucosamine--N-acetylmuramyl-(pentapeptide) pyrophosphoryl-undecaprenol N-acetylglucosamine transferase
MVKRVCLVSSGTGGHLLPAVILARALRDAGDDTVVLTEGRQPERLLLERYPCRAEALPMDGGRLGLPWRLVGAAMRARRFLRREHVDVVVGTGGRNTVPVGLAAKSLGLPVVLMEQNAVPGRANRWLWPLAHRVYLGLPTVRPTRRGMLTGTPLRAEFGLIGRAEARRGLGLAQGVPVVLVTGGSQGARALNELVPDALCRLRRPLQVLHLSGPDHLQNVRLRYAAGEAHGVAAFVRTHAFDMATYYAAADLVLCRGGGGTVAELAAAGRPAIIVPYPHHRDRQQYWNGKVLEDAGAAVVVEQSGLTAATLAALVESLFRCERLEAMGERARSLARANACQSIVEDLDRVVAEG